MYAVIETGGKQYRVEVGTELEVELLDVEPGKTITLDRVLLVADGDESRSAGRWSPTRRSAPRSSRQTRGAKLISFKYRPKARSRVKKGHRQELTVLRISDITLGGKSAAKAAKKAEDDAKTERQRLEEAAAAQAAKDAELAAKLAVGADGRPRPTAKAAPRPAAKAEDDEPTGRQGRRRPDAQGQAAKPKAAARPTAPKRTTAKAATPKAAARRKADAPKKPRATKKDE